MTPTKKHHSVADVRMVELTRHADDNGELVVAESGADVPFTVARYFAVKAPVGAKRGNHAHRFCSQYLICAHGAVDVVCTDGASERTFVLDRSNLGLMIPPNIWNTIIYRQKDSVLVVLCDRPYEVEDYIRDYPEFLALQKTGGSR